MSTPQTDDAFDLSNPWYAQTTGVCALSNYTGWMDVFYCINPGYWAFLGLALALGFSVIGAAW